jgi:hypothetical protein
MFGHGRFAVPRKRSSLADDVVDVFRKCRNRLDSPRTADSVKSEIARVQNPLISRFDNEHIRIKRRMVNHNRGNGNIADCDLFKRLECADFLEQRQLWQFFSLCVIHVNRFCCPAEVDRNIGVDFAQRPHMVAVVMREE